MSSKANIVLISGGNQGIGLAAAKRLASENTDYHVIIGSRNAANGTAAANDLSSSHGLSVSSVQLDVTDDASIAAAVSHVESEYGRLDVLINNAGVFLDGSTDLSTRDLFAKTFDANVFGSVCLTEAFLPLLRKSALPRIVFVSSSLASFALTEVQALEYHKADAKAYQSSKAAMSMLALNYAKKLEADGFKVNAMCPGLVSTKINGYVEAGETPDTGASRVVTLATLGRDGETGTYSSREGPVSW
ncbi:hypothetical protein MMC20_000049 [Loxospora ochrophaea]|nr:hypothetical protein [Loxospora ochrophaea]